MEKFYLTFIVSISSMYILKQFYPYNKKNENTQRPIDTMPTTEEFGISNKKQVESNISIEENDFSVEHFDDNDCANKESELYVENSVKPIITTKNTFLYPDDDFGIMTEGKV